ncbi:uncharacterized protein L201_003843 [Kwoniella dendrophila CBS 6074]|uniref:NmrA-like domain-containing protein n=1 Tax=Kwoniella dendrophila CBS 6074 TaxID=1295534 RepID=A0AAX4JVR2_9TREE
MVKSVNLFSKPWQLWKQMSVSKSTIARASKKANVKNYIPSYHTSHIIGSDAEAAEYDAVGGGHIAEKYRMEKEIEKLGVPATFVCTGLFIDIARNAGELTERNLKVPYPLSSFQYIAQGLAEIAASQDFPSPTQSRTLSLIEFSPTGQEIVSAVEQVNGSSPELTIVSEEDNANRKSGKVTSPMPFYRLVAFMREKWGNGEVLGAELGGDIAEWKVSGKARSLVDRAKELKDNPPSPPVPPKAKS